MTDMQRVVLVSMLPRLSLDDLTELHAALVHQMRKLAETAGAYCCPTCHVVSHNPHDLANRYCANCHQFSEAHP